MSEEKDYIRFIDPNSRKEKKYRFVTDFYTVSPTYWDSIDMKFDNDQRLFHGPIPKTNISSVLRGTGFYVDEGDYNDPRIDDFVGLTFSRFPPSNEVDFEHDIAVSFAGEDREVVDIIAQELRKNKVNVFYDNFFKADLIGKDLSDYFKEKYGKKTKYMVPFISKSYTLKDWTNFEFEIAHDEAERRIKEFILPVRLDTTIMQGLKRTIAYISFIHEGIEGIIKILLEKLNLPYIIPFIKNQKIEEIEKVYSIKNSSQDVEKDLKEPFEKRIYNVDKNDDRIPFLRDLIKNLTIQHYKARYDHNTNRIIYRIVDFLSSFKDHYFNEYIQSGRPTYSKIIMKFFNCSIDEFKSKIENKEISDFNIERYSFMRAGDIALILFDRFEKPKQYKNELVESVRKDYTHELSKYKYCKEEYKKDLFKKALTILEDEYNLIKTSEEYNGSDSPAEYQIISISRIKQFSKTYSINYFLRQLDNY